MNHSFVGHSGNQSFGRLWPKNTLICFELWIIYVPDGKRLVYSARLAKGEGYRLFVRDLPNGASRQLTGAADSFASGDSSPRPSFRRIKRRLPARSAIV